MSYDGFFIALTCHHFLTNTAKQQWDDKCFSPTIDKIYQCPISIVHHLLSPHIYRTKNGRSTSLLHRQEHWKKYELRRSSQHKSISNCQHTLSSSASNLTPLLSHCVTYAWYQKQIQWEQSTSLSNCPQIFLHTPKPLKPDWYMGAAFDTPMSSEFIHCQKRRAYYLVCQIGGSQVGRGPGAGG